MSPPLLQNGAVNGQQEHESEKPNSPLSVFLIVSAKAYSSIGFGLSVLAIWVRWFLPGKAVAATALQIKVAGAPPARRHSRLRSLPKISEIPPPTPIRRSSAPPSSSHLVPIFGQKHDHLTNQVPRRVYFADLSNSMVRRNTTPPERPKPLPEVEEDNLPSPPPTATFAPALTESPPPSAPSSVTTTPMMVTITTLDTPIINDTTSKVEHDINATTPSSTPRQRKLRLSFNLKAKRTTPEKDKPREQTTSQQENVIKTSKKSSHPLALPWATSRVSESSDSTEPAAPAKVSTSILGFHRSSSPSAKSCTSSSSSGSLPSLILQKKSQRRVSAPIPRTSPYEAPYFATPPLILDASYSQHLRKLPQFEDEVTSNASHSSRPGRPTNASGDRPSSSSGVPQKAQKPVPKRRSASVSWEERRIPGALQL